MQLTDLRTFVAVCDSDSLSAVARQLGVPKSTVARRIARLETELGATLVQRSHLGAVATAAGLQVRRRAERILAEVDALHSDVPAQPARLRVVASPILAQAPAFLRMVHDFITDHRSIELELISTAARLDLLKTGTDLALRLHLSPLSGEPTLMSRRLGTVDGGIFAAPAMAARTWTGPEDLTTVPVITTQAGVLRHRWPLEHPTQGSAVVQIEPVLRTSDLQVVTQAVVEGLGVGLLPVYATEAAVERGALVRILPQWCPPSVRVSALWLRASPMPAPVRAFLDALAEGPAPWRPPHSAS